jgi:hypothetical protein
MAAHPDIPTAQKEIQRTEVRSSTLNLYTSPKHHLIHAFSSRGHRHVPPKMPLLRRRLALHAARHEVVASTASTHCYLTVDGRFTLPKHAHEL